MQLYEVMYAKLAQDVTTHDKGKTIPAGSMVELQFDAMTDVYVVLGDKSIFATMAEVRGSSLIEGHER